MEPAFIVVWGAALLAIAILLVVVVVILQRTSRPTALTADEHRGFKPFKHALLFHHEDQSVRSTARGQVIIRIPGVAWDVGWQTEPIRLEVNEEDPGSVDLPPEWRDAKVLTAFTLSGYRMTEMGTDIGIERFAAPIDVILTTAERDQGLRCGTCTDSSWALAPTTTITVDELPGMDLLAERGWVAVSVTRLGRICLIKLPAASSPVARRVMLQVSALD